MVCLVSSTSFPCVSFFPHHFNPFLKLPIPPSPHLIQMGRAIATMGRRATIPRMHRDQRGTRGGELLHQLQGVLDGTKCGMTWHVMNCILREVFLNTCHVAYSIFTRLRLWFAFLEYCCYGQKYQYDTSQVEPGKPGAEVSKKKNYKSKKEFAYRMCTGWPTTAMPKPSFLSERAFSRSMVVMWWPVLMWLVAGSDEVLRLVVRWREVR